MWQWWWDLVRMVVRDADPSLGEPPSTPFNLINLVKRFV
jgi:hypothetical protein